MSWFGPMEEGGNPGTIGKAKQGPPVHPPGHPIDVLITDVLTTNSETLTLPIGRARPSGRGATRERRGSTRSQIRGALPCQRPSSIVRCPVAKWSRCPRLRPPGGTGLTLSCRPTATPARPTSIRSSPTPSNATNRRTSPPTSPSARSVPFLSSSDELGGSASLRPRFQLGRPASLPGRGSSPIRGKSSRLFLRREIELQAPRLMSIRGHTAPERLKCKGKIT